MVDISKIKYLYWYTFQKKQPYEEQYRSYKFKILFLNDFDKQKY